MNGTFESACWIRIDTYHRRAVIEERGICRKVCKKSTKQLKIIQTIFCKKKAAAKTKYDFLRTLCNAENTLLFLTAAVTNGTTKEIENCSQIFTQHQSCLIQNISYDSSSDAFPVQLKLHRCRKR